MSEKASLRGTRRIDDLQSLERSISLYECCTFPVTSFATVKNDVGR